MNWQAYLLLRILCSSVIYAILLKNVSSLGSKTTRQFWMYSLAVLWSILLFLSAGHNGIDSRFVQIFVIGMLNSVGFYCQLRAFAISLSKASLFTQADDLISMILGYAILGELGFLTPSLTAGILLCLLAAMILAKYTHGLALLGWIAGYSFIWGMAMFAMRWFGSGQMPLPAFILSWYSGSLLGSAILLLLVRHKEEGSAIAKSAIPNLAPASLFMWLSLILAYSAFVLAPVTVVQPILMVSELVFPTLLGLYWFREKNCFTGKEKAAMLIAAAGTLTIALSF